MPRRFWRFETGLFLAIWIVLMVSGRGKFFSDPGALWHIVVGQRILSSGALIQTDPFSCTFGGQPWIAQQWLGECALSLVHEVAGLDAILLGTATFLAALYTWVASRLLRGGMHPLLVLLVTATALAGSSYHFHPRPHLLTILLTGWTFARLCDFEWGRIRLSRLFWLLPLFVLWTNVHGGMVGGVMTLALAVLGWGVARFLGLPTPVTCLRQLVPLTLLVLGCGLTALVNPYRLDLLKVWFALVNSPLLPHLIEEHGPLLSAGPLAWGTLLFGVLYVAALAGIRPTQVRITWLIPLVWLVLAWTRVRHGPLFVITGAVALADMFPHVRWVGWLARKGSVVCQIRGRLETKIGRPREWRPWVVPLGMVLLTGLLQWAAIPVPVLGHGWASPDRKSCPLEVLPELREYARDRPAGTPIFNDMRFSGFLIYFTPELRVFLDDRCELYGEEWLARHAADMRDHPEKIEDWATKYGFDLALVPTESGFDHYLRDAEGWTLLKRTQTAVLFQRCQVLPGRNSSDVTSNSSHRQNGPLEGNLTEQLYPE